MPEGKGGWMSPEVLGDHSRASWPRGEGYSCSFFSSLFLSVRTRLPESPEWLCSSLTASCRGTVAIQLWRPVTSPRSGSILLEKEKEVSISQTNQRGKQKGRYLSYFNIKCFFKAINTYNTYEGTNCKLLSETQIQIHVAMQIQ